MYYEIHKIKNKYYVVYNKDIIFFNLTNSEIRIVITMFIILNVKYNVIDYDNIIVK